MEEIVIQGFDVPNTLVSRKYKFSIVFPFVWATGTNFQKDPLTATLSQIRITISNK